MFDTVNCVVGAGIVRFVNFSIVFQQCWYCALSGVVSDYFVSGIGIESMGVSIVDVDCILLALLVF